MIWIALIIGIILIFIFPKQMGILAALAVVGIAGVYLYLQAEENDRKKQRDAVSINITYGSPVCSSDFSLAVNIMNGSRKTVTKVRWNIGAYKPGYSNNVVDYGYSSEYSTPYESDKILSPNQSFAVCYKTPKLNSGNKPDSVNWSAVSKSVVFY